MRLYFLERCPDFFRLKSFSLIAAMPRSGSWPWGEMRGFGLLSWGHHLRRVTSARDCIRATTITLATSLLNAGIYRAKNQQTCIAAAGWGNFTCIAKKHK
ncbi:hypothetical protein C5Y97_05795 [Blastopirellula marina]|uniref:Uncharacterized protein n=1 Tax=Blastopirellula marina TaxID=124 RepID=A0A2S8G8G3_9BACT|nr:hypothetical protein C5Y98_05795 [Blastopirellula marina]PTL45689.1 hypothetical protein C5Y97_05795 [Blastopirellula marina]